jgi:hypothetical protein
VLAEINKEIFTDTLMLIINVFLYFAFTIAPL